jgi:hypothetical protein
MISNNLEVAFVEKALTNSGYLERLETNIGNGSAQSNPFDTFIMSKMGILANARGSVLDESREREILKHIVKECPMLATTKLPGILEEMGRFFQKYSKNKKGKVKVLSERDTKRYTNRMRKHLAQIALAKHPQNLELIKAILTRRAGESSKRTA